MVEISTDPLNNADLRIGNLEVRLAATAAEIDAAQRLRYEIFYNEMAAQPSPEMAARCRDFDRYDDVCDHLLVIDHNRGDGPEGVVGTYRLIRRAVANRTGGFYSSSEYDISQLDSYPGEILELGRSCVDVDYRTRGTMQLLWRGIAAYVWELKIGLMFGCGSLRGTDLQALALPLSYLYFHHLAPEDLRPVALPDRFSDMRLMRPETINRREALGKLPPLIKGYLRLGGFVGDGAVIDHQFNTTDVCIVVKTELVTEKYYRHYDRQNTTTGKTGIPA